MNSTGNDIVSLNAINIPRTKQQRFYSKILAATEIAAYSAHKADISFENFVWLSWSIKESAYKFLQRNNPGLVFSPIKCLVTQLEFPAQNQSNDSIAILEGTGFDGLPAIKSKITVGSETLYARSLISRDFIFSVVSHDDHVDDTRWGVKLIDDVSADNQSAEVRAFLLKKLTGVISCDNPEITKNAHGCPILLNEGNDIPISLAHHGQWIGYSYQLDRVDAYTV